MADRRAVKQILLNLLSNAVKFTENGGRIMVGAALEERYVTISIVDTGIGIGEDDLPRLGDPFFQVETSYDRPRDGTGLGLSIVKGLLALQDGRMAIESRLGEGTRITIALPAIGATRIPESVGQKAERASAASSESSNLKVKKRA